MNDHGTTADRDARAGARSRLADPAAAALWTTVVGLLALAASALVVLSFRDELPDPVAIHWGPDGADGFAAAGSPTYLAAPTAIGAALTIGLGVLTWRMGRSGSQRRLLGATTVAVAVLIGTAQAVSLAAQRGLADAHEASDSGVGAALLTGLVAGVLTFVALPGDPPLPSDEPVAADASRTALADDERAAWVVRTAGGPGAAIGAGVVAVSLTVAVATQVWWILAAPAVVTFLTLAMFSWVVRVDDRGLHVRSALGYPRTTIPPDEVERAGTTTVRPFPQFGGWGWRGGRGGRVGVVLRRGPALLVEQTGGRSFVVTVDDPAEGASLLNTLADRARG